MNSRERIIAALNFKEPDRIPIDFGGHRSSGIMAVAYAKLKKSLGIKTGNIYIYDMVQQLAIIEDSVLNILHSDTIEMGRGFLKNESDWKDWILPDGTACKIPNYINISKKGVDWFLYAQDGTEIGVQKEGCLYFEQTLFPMADRDFENDPFDDIEEQFKHCIWTAVPHPGGHLSLNVEGLKELSLCSEQLRKSTDKAILGLFGGNLFEVPQFLFRNDNYLLYLAMYPDAVHRLSEKLCNIYIANLEKWLPAVSKNIDVIVFGDDFGSNNGPIISPEMYREFFKPYHKKMWTKVKELAPHLKINLHSCGSIEPFLNDFIEAGLDAVNPVQISCNDMNPEELKNKYGDKICFWGGGCDTQTILPSKTVNEIEKHVKEMIKIWQPNGGYVFQQVHNIMSNVSPDNIKAVFNTLKSN